MGGRMGCQQNVTDVPPAGRSGAAAGRNAGVFARRARLPGRLSQADGEVFVVATRKKVATIRQPARSEPRRDPATFEVPPRRHR